jgi:hypothetical protein
MLSKQKDACGKLLQIKNKLQDEYVSELKTQDDEYVKELKWQSEEIGILVCNNRQTTATHGLSIQ